MRAIREPIKGFGLLSDFALRKARSALGGERMTGAHPSLVQSLEHTDDELRGAVAGQAYLDGGYALEVS